MSCENHLRTNILANNYKRITTITTTSRSPCIKLIDLQLIDEL